MWTHLSFVLSQIMRLTDERTDKQTEFSSLDCVFIPCSEVKMIVEFTERRWKWHMLFDLLQIIESTGFAKRLSGSD